MSGIEVRVAGVDCNAFSGQGSKYVGRIGEIVGVSGQFVKVRFPNETYAHLFLPGELKQF